MVPDLNQRINAFSLLGRQFTLISQAIMQDKPELLQSPAAIQMYEKAIDSPNHNPWFTTDNVSQALEALGEMLKLSSLQRWCAEYNEYREQTNAKQRTVAVIMAGNLPLVGFHDFLCVLISGNRFLGKLSSQDKHLPVSAANLLLEIEPDFGDSISFTENTISGFEAVIATGSNNSSRYFDYYFGKYPHIIRRNRSAIAILSGNETHEELVSLGKDVFSYYGLGCRNVSLIFIPAGFNIPRLAKAWQQFSDIVNNHKYGNNYDYQKAILLINNIPFTDTGFCLLRHSTSIVSPVSVVNLYEYKDARELDAFIEQNQGNIQCISSNIKLETHTTAIVGLGKSQQPELWDYADGIDTLDFLLKLR